MTPEQLAEIKARLDAATPGPWERGYPWLTAGVTWSDSGANVGPKEGTRCAYCNHGEPVWAGRRDINGTVMPAHHHRSPEPYDTDHQISGPPGVALPGNYDYEVGGILSPEDTEFIAHARTDVPALLAEVERLKAKLDMPCGSCHPCTNYADETWRAAGRTPPHVYRWDEARAEVERLTAQRDGLLKAADRADANGVHVMSTSLIRDHLKADGGETPCGPS